jgi:hypothetical protein
MISRLARKKACSTEFFLQKAECCANQGCKTTQVQANEKADDERMDFWDWFLHDSVLDPKLTLSLIKLGSI